MQKINPIGYLKNAHGLVCPHIKYIPDHVGQYKIIRQHATDSTLALTYALLSDVVKPVAEKSSYYIPDGEPVGEVSYIVGDIMLETFDADGTEEKPWCTHGEKASMAVTCLHM